MRTFPVEPGEEPRKVTEANKARLRARNSSSSGTSGAITDKTAVAIATVFAILFLVMVVVIANAPKSPNPPAASEPSEPTGQIDYHNAFAVVTVGVKILPCCDVTKALIFVRGDSAIRMEMVAEGYAAVGEIPGGTRVYVAGAFTLAEDGVGFETSHPTTEDVALIVWGKGGYVPMWALKFEQP